jgi:hypothetical protein
MKKSFRNWLPLVGSVCMIICLRLFVEVIAPTSVEPLTKTTWDGHPAWGQIHTNSWYTFYYRVPRPGGHDLIGPEIASFPQGEAFYLH